MYHLIQKRQQFNIFENWSATNWSGVCGQLSKVTIPTLVVTGTEDIAVPGANSLIIAQKIPGAWLVQIKGAGHALMNQYPRNSAQYYKHFLQQPRHHLTNPLAFVRNIDGKSVL